MAPFLLFYYWLLSGHAVWRDEINAWAIACVSRNLPDLLARVHFEAHPALWYGILFLASRISSAVWMLKVVQGLIGTAIYLLLALSAPLRRWELALIYGGYYIAFQYTVMCRMYGLEVLFLLIYLWARMNHPERRARNTLWLALMANVDMTAMVLATALLLEYGTEIYIQQQRRLRAFLRAAAGMAAVYLLGVAVSLATLWPAREIGWASTGRPGSLLFDPLHLGEALAFWLGVPWYPQAVSQIGLWPNLWPAGLFAPLVVALYAPIFWKRWAMARLYFSTLLLGVLFSHLVGVAAVRHIGVAYLAFLAVLWMMRYRNERVSPFSYVLLGSVTVSSFCILAAQWNKPFTDADQAAYWIHAQKLDTLPIFGTPDTMLVSVTERLGRPAYQLDCNCVDAVMTFHQRHDEYAKYFWQDRDSPWMRKTMVERVTQGMRTMQTHQALLVLDYPLPDAQQTALKTKGVAVSQAARFTQGYLEDEHFYLYRLTAQSERSADVAALKTGDSLADNQIPSLFLARSKPKPGSR